MWYIYIYISIRIYIKDLTHPGCKSDNCMQQRGSLPISKKSASAFCHLSCVFGGWSWGNAHSFIHWSIPFHAIPFLVSFIQLHIPQRRGIERPDVKQIIDVRHHVAQEKNQNNTQRISKVEEAEETKTKDNASQKESTSSPDPGGRSLTY